MRGVYSRGESMVHQKKRGPLPKAKGNPRAVGEALSGRGVSPMALLPNTKFGLDFLGTAHPDVLAY